MFCRTEVQYALFQITPGVSQFNYSYTNYNVGSCYVWLYMVNVSYAANINWQKWRFKSIQREGWRCYPSLQEDLLQAWNVYWVIFNFGLKPACSLLSSSCFSQLSSSLLSSSCCCPWTCQNTNIYTYMCVCVS